jgi:hypothetical protein
VTRPDIELGATVKAKRLRFERAPETDVELEGDWETHHERRNLPDEVEPGVTYREVEVSWGVGARLESR